MGNQPSRTPTPGGSSSHPQSPVASVTSPTSHGPYHDRERAQQHNPKRRESIQALSTVFERKASVAPPSASLESAAALTAPARPRSRSQTVSAATTTAHVTNTLRAAQDTFKAASNEKMGNDQSRPRGHHPRDLTPPKPKPTPAPAPAPVDEKPMPSPKTAPMPLPIPRDQPHSHGSSRFEPTSAASLEPADASQEAFVVPSSHYSRPPRLPLPIEEEPVGPGSPIISPADPTSLINHDEVEGALPRRSSMLSDRTADADDDDLADEFKGPQGQVTVPTLIEWDGPGERVFVTGTFAGWERKFKLHPDGPSKKKDVLSAYVHITPGTHHLMFIVDNDMRTSDKMPTAVDYTNILVNYIEVSYDDIPKPEADTKDESKKSESAPVPVQDQQAPAGIYPPQVLPATPEHEPVKKPLPEPKPKVPAPAPKQYHQSIPRYLLDLDAPEDSRRFARANAAGGALPAPPTLPMFLSKSILNGTTPMKDDSSVLIMPNHTVLNHLATSSIKDNILATSATTRYKQKFLTTIMYKPRGEDSDY
ncbi:AMPKBI-domain-containing protein [Paraphaeosphaeria sporulosa]|uniref:AMPKBI-domain-containing protein n=1 Tax=Paraphaeosphaeria sporulosa TaxID=1460663 RepID=A0A177CCS1_9PLEO|nr:AMPKBI-domain-containing protein [Paraphaeosphaeria sporulosa]OAG05433.1 AMPKBI-domain-containing protein [Paraphaeosphaeria sporulosa]